MIVCKAFFANDKQKPCYVVVGSNAHAVEIEFEEDGKPISTIYACLFTLREAWTPRELLARLRRTPTAIELDGVELVTLMDPTLPASQQMELGDADKD